MFVKTTSMYLTLLLVLAPAGTLCAQEPSPSTTASRSGLPACLPLLEDEGLHLRDLDAVRGVNERAALEAALARAQADRRRQERESDRLAQGRLSSVTPREVAEVLRFEYGAGSAVSRSASAVASIADAAERGTQVPLDRVNAVTKRLAVSSSKALGLPSPPQLRLRSRVTTRKAGVGVSTKW